MTILLGSEPITVHSGTRVQDAHGWSEAQAPAPIWTGAGNLQLQPPTEDRMAAERGGHGPYDPRHAEAGQCYVDGSAIVQPGDVVEVRGRMWLVNGVQDVLDPFTGGPLDCRVLHVSELVEVTG